MIYILFYDDNSTFLGFFTHYQKALDAKDKYCKDYQVDPKYLFIEDFELDKLFV